MSGVRPPVIGITPIRSQAGGRYAPQRQGQNETYLDALARAGAAPLIIPYVAQPELLRALFDLLDGLLLPGGEDVAPASYGQAQQAWCGRISPERDDVELRLARWAMAGGLPVLAICRGIQVLNVALGGNLHQDIATEVPGSGKHDWYPDHPRDRLSHDVALAPGSRLATLAGTTSLSVNSLHHQALQNVAPGLAVVARAPDRVIEAVEAPDHPFALGVQWHPEELAANDPRAQRLFDALAEAAKK